MKRRRMREAQAVRELRNAELGVTQRTARVLLAHAIQKVAVRGPVLTQT